MDENEVAEEPAKEKNPMIDKLFKEKNNWRAKANELETKLKEFEQKEMIQKEEWKTLSEKYSKEKNEWQEKYTKLNSEILTAKKLGAVKNELLKMGADPKAVPMLVKLADAEKIEEDSGVIVGAEQVAMMIKEAIPTAFGIINRNVQEPPDVKMTGKLTLEDYKKLSPEDQKKRESELYEQYNIKLKR